MIRHRYHITCDINVEQYVNRSLFHVWALCLYFGHNCVSAYAYVKLLPDHHKSQWWVQGWRSCRHMEWNLESYLLRYYNKTFWNTHTMLVLQAFRLSEDFLSDDLQITWPVSYFTGSAASLMCYKLPPLWRDKFEQSVCDFWFGGKKIVKVGLKFILEFFTMCLQFHVCWWCSLNYMYVYLSVWCVVLLKHLYGGFVHVLHVWVPDEYSHGIVMSQGRLGF